MNGFYVIEMNKGTGAVRRDWDSARRWSYIDFLGEPSIIRQYIHERREIVKKELQHF